MYVYQALIIALAFATLVVRVIALVVDIINKTKK